MQWGWTSRSGCSKNDGAGDSYGAERSSGLGRGRSVQWDQQSMSWGSSGGYVSGAGRERQAHL